MITDNGKRCICCFNDGKCMYVYSRTTTIEGADPPIHLSVCAEPSIVMFANYAEAFAVVINVTTID